jgi:hypothetical protein
VDSGHCAARCVRSEEMKEGPAISQSEEVEQCSKNSGTQTVGVEEEEGGASSNGQVAGSRTAK